MYFHDSQMSRDLQINDPHNICLQPDKHKLQTGEHELQIGQHIYIDRKSVV